MDSQPQHEFQKLQIGYQTHFAYESDKDRSRAMQAFSHTAGEGGINKAFLESNLAMCISIFNEHLLS